MPENLRVIRTRKNDKLIAVLCNDSRYKIHDTGQIDSLVQRTGKLSANGIFRTIKPYLNREGYHRVKYSYVDLFVHRIIYQKFIGDLDAALVINHIDGNKTNNVPSNLEQVTHQKNMDHLVDLMKKRNTSLLAKHVGFSGAQRIRQDYEAGLTREQLSEKYKITVQSIRSILMNKTYKVQNVESFH